MHHQPNDEQLDHFFQRLNRPLKRLPQPLRAELHQELRQHLDALAAAHEELGSPPEEAFQHALRQFGDPGRVGRKLWWEWFLTSCRPSEAVRAAGYALLLYALCDLLFALPSLLAPIGPAPIPGSLRAAMQSGGGGFLRYVQTLELLIGLAMTLGVPSLVGLLVGRKFPRHALQAMFGVALAPTVWILPSIVFSSLPLGQSAAGPWPAALACAALFGGLGALCGATRRPPAVPTRRPR